MGRKVWGLLVGGVLTGCYGRTYAPVLTLMPPDPPAPTAGRWVGGEGGRIPGQYVGESGGGFGLSAGGAYLSRFFRVEFVGSAWGGSYRYTDPARSGTALFTALEGLVRAGLLLPLGGVRLEAGLGVGLVSQNGVPRGIDLLPVWFAGGPHVGMGIPDRFWVRAAYGSVNTGVSLSVALSGNWWLGGSAVRWWDPPGFGLRLGVFRRGR